jgi:Tat protein translocase TatB subunit
MPQIGPLEILVIGAIALIVFGPEKLPEIARTIGRTANQLRKMASEVKDEFDLGLDDEDEDEDDEGSATRTRPEARPDHPNLTATKSDSGSATTERDDPSEDRPETRTDHPNLTATTGDSGSVQPEPRPADDPGEERRGA